MIPKIIHYCWFGRGKLPELAVKCINSWKKYCPDYEIIEWNEENFNINCCAYVKEAYDNKKYAFVADYVRLFAMYNLGGIYMDTDVELVSSLESFLHHQGFRVLNRRYIYRLQLWREKKDFHFIKNF